MPGFTYSKELNTEINAVYFGNFDFESSPKAVVLNSRQTKTPTGNDPWIVNTVRAINDIAKRDWIVLVSLGMNTWELPLWAASDIGARLVILATAKSEEERNSLIEQTAKQYDLDSSRVGWVFAKSTAGARSEKADWPKRDKLAVTLADIIMPVSVRSGGNLDTLIRNLRDKKIINDFNVKYKPKAAVKEFNPTHLDPVIPRKNWDYITHWTRTCYGPWPDESKASYYRRLTESKRGYTGDALATLKNILNQNHLRSSSRNLREGLSGVAFSSLHPADILPLMRWRKRYVRWGFEPYGIAIARTAAIALGINPVLYARSELYDKLLESDKPYFQNEGESGAWREEQEWRYLGDLDLNQIEAKDMIIIVRSQDEIKLLEGLTQSQVLSFT